MNYRQREWEARRRFVIFLIFHGLRLGDSGWIRMIRKNPHDFGRLLVLTKRDRETEEEESRRPQSPLRNSPRSWVLSGKFNGVSVQKRIFSLFWLLAVLRCWTIRKEFVSRIMTSNMKFYGDDVIIMHPARLAFRIFHFCCHFFTFCSRCSYASDLPLAYAATPVE